MTATLSPRVAVFAGAFDPITNGHVAIVQNALALFEKVIVGVGHNIDKQSLFTPEERVAMIREIFPDPRVVVKDFQGLVVRFAAAEGAGVLVRGLRTETDFQYEMPMALTNKQLEARIQTVFIPTTGENLYLSSSLVREVAYHGGDVRAFVPANVSKKLAAKFRR